ncbi:MAG: 50S ribosomal protein L24 [Zetaproteobacteria bacterium]|nr:MAG: 50S ribosomal protein L24 [Zetaproteobacteria bacterium]
MVAKMKLRRDDEVVVIAGRDRGARGRIVRVLPAEGRVVVSKVNMVRRHTRPSDRSAGGIVSVEAPLSVSNVQFYCPACARGVRLGIKRLEDGRKVRFCRKCGEVVDS